MIKVLIVDDSIIFRKILSETLKHSPRIRVVGTAENGKEAIKLITALKPHVVILDVEMPVMDGLETLEEMNRRNLKPGVIMFSTLTSKGAKTTLEALSKGAFDFVQKPTGTGAFVESKKKIQTELIPRIMAYADSIKERRSPIQQRPEITQRTSAKRPETRIKKGQRTLASKGLTTKIASLHRLSFRPQAVAIGVSTGGPNALNHVIPNFPAHFKLPIFLVQHMPPIFTKQLAERLNSRSKLTVVEATDGQVVRPGTVYIAPGDYHMLVKKGDNDYVIRLNQGPPVNSCRPAVDPLFESIADSYGGRVIGVILTGMGSDGRLGAKRLKEKGAFIIAQDKETSVVFGMPRFVAEDGTADKVVPIDLVTPSILELCK